MTHVISIEGNIGSGKSTLVERLRQVLPISEYYFVAEPVESWSSVVDEQGVDILTRFYEDQAKFAFPFQMMAYISRLAMLKDAVAAHPDKVIVTERSVLTDRHVFAKMMHDEGMIDEISYKIYLKWFNYFLKDIPDTKMVYVNTCPEECFERVHSRQRAGEQSIPLKYLQECGAYHTRWLDQPGVLVIHGDEKKTQTLDPFEGWCETIREWLGSGNAFKTK